MQKSVLLFFPPIPFVVFYIVRIERLLRYPEFEPYIDRPSLARIEQLLFGILVIFLVLLAGWVALRKSAKPHSWFVSVAINTWFISMALASYAVGPYSSPVLLGFLAGGMTAFLLYDARRASIGSILGMVVLVSTHALERAGVLTYGPVFSGVVFGGHRPPDAWALWNFVFTFVLTGFVLGATGLVMTIARQNQAELQTLLRVDPLTGLSNRRTVDALLGLELARARRTGASVSVVMLDIDHFKNVNDTHGHPAGDAVLTAVGEVIRSCLRQVDVAGRYGGEELMLVLPETDHQGAFAAAERVRVAIEALVVDSGSSSLIRVTVSGGCAVWASTDEPDASALVRSADTALYRAKAGGRNRIEIDHPSDPTPTA